MPNMLHASVKQLSEKIKGFGKKPTSRFAFFLGAGASRQSGIITASEMIHFFKERIIALECPQELKTESDKEKWLGEQEWFQADGSDYSKLFTHYEPKEMGRQRYIENIVEGRNPSFGYLVLANLMASKYINTVITTNFDDLIYSASTTYTDIRPIVYAYGVLASEMRITASRPKILKLHGDYLYSALKNTDTETAIQDPNMTRQVSQVLNEYGLVVVGYSGWDCSIMSILSKISEKNDLYWCLHRGSKLNEAVERLLSDKRGFLIEIEGFDVRAMIGSTQKHQDQVIANLRTFAPRYSGDILTEIAEALQDQAAEQQKQIRKIQALDLSTKASKSEDAQHLEEAERLYRSAIELSPLVTS